MDITPSKIIDDFIVTSIAPLLKENKFSKSGRSWLQTHDDFSFVISVQGDRYNRKDENVTFFINYGIYLPVVARLSNEQPISRPKEYDCSIRERQTNTATKSQDWIIDSTLSNTDQLAKQVNHDLNNGCLKFFKSLQTLDDVLDAIVTITMESGVRYATQGIILAMYLHKKAEAQKIFDKAYLYATSNTPTMDVFAGRLEAMAKQYQLVY